ncbi:hypothetical protein MWH25_05615 [Natroniella acetigena]|uniref:hypothetical protein n=1 Tax=Natroniella acetigena TaxID=52004 RepID=UPI00200A3DEB|nr:hypothetical protein [Natroniella acetigena]MCK8827217.1 hypothetical protein [Natroniella acetigena]
MRKDEVERLIKIAKNLKAKKDNNQITDFEKDELKEIYKLLIVDDDQKNEI